VQSYPGLRPDDMRVPGAMREGAERERVYPLEGIIDRGETSREREYPAEAVTDAPRGRMDVAWISKMQPGSSMPTFAPGQQMWYS